MRYSRFVRRIAVTGEASVRSCATEDSEDGTLLDVSRKGARLCINRLFRPGQKFTLMMNLPWDEPPVEVRLATVKWVHQNTVGVEFLKVENDERVLLDVFSPLDLNYQRRKDEGPSRSEKSRMSPFVPALFAELWPGDGDVPPVLRS